MVHFTLKIYNTDDDLALYNSSVRMGQMAMLPTSTILPILGPEMSIAPLEGPSMNISPPKVPPLSSPDRSNSNSNSSSGSTSKNPANQGNQSKVEKSTKTESVGDKFTKKTEVRPGKGPGQSRAEYVTVKNSTGKTIKTYKNSYDRGNKFQGRKPLKGGPEGRTN